MIMINRRPWYKKGYYILKIVLIYFMNVEN